MAKFPRNLQKKLAQRHLENAFRRLDSKSGLVDFSSNDYLGLAKEKTVMEMAQEIMVSQKTHQNGATGSRLLSGNHPLYKTLEEYLSAFHTSEAALVFNSGYDANLGFFSTVPQRGDVIFYDEFCHASIRDGIQLSHAKSYKFKHNDLKDLESVIERNRDNHQTDEAYVVSESVFSMDGDSTDLLALTSFCEKRNLNLVIDEAHALGVHHKGKIDTLQLEKKVFARIITFGKALGVHGSAVLGSADLRDFLINFCKSFIYTTGLPPHTLATILAAYQFLESKKGVELWESLHDNIAYFKAVISKNGLSDYFIESNSAIQVCKIGGNDNVKRCSKILEENQFDVRPILSPTVPQGSERLRFCIHAFNTKEEIKMALQMVKSSISR